MIFVSYNIRWGTGKDGRIDLPRIAGEIGAAEVIALFYFGDTIHN